MRIFNSRNHQDAISGRTSLSRRGLSLIEATVMMVVLSIVSVGVGVGLQSATRAPEGSDRFAAVSAELTSEMENWRAVAWGASPWPATFPYTASGTVTLRIAGQNVTYNRTTSISYWDPNNLSGDTAPKTDFVRIQITIGSQSSTTYLTSPS
jgi:Tfp pilus assembly protein PilV